VVERVLGSMICWRKLMCGDEQRHLRSGSVDHVAKGNLLLRRTTHGMFRKVAAGIPNRF